MLVCSPEQFSQTVNNEQKDKFSYLLPRKLQELIFFLFKHNGKHSGYSVSWIPHAPSSFRKFTYAFSCAWKVFAQLFLVLRSWLKWQILTERGFLWFSVAIHTHTPIILIAFTFPRIIIFQYILFVYLFNLCGSLWNIRSIKLLYLKCRLSDRDTSDTSEV